MSSTPWNYYKQHDPVDRLQRYVIERVHLEGRIDEEMPIGAVRLEAGVLAYNQIMRSSQDLSHLKMCLTGIRRELAEKTFCGLPFKVNHEIDEKSVKFYDGSGRCVETWKVSL